MRLTKKLKSKLGLKGTKDEINFSLILGVFQRWISTSDQNEKNQILNENRKILEASGIKPETIIEEGIEAFHKIMTKCYFQIQKAKVERIEKRITSLVFKEKGSSYKDFRKQVTNLEENKLKVHELKKSTLLQKEQNDLSPEEIEKRKELFHEIANEYLGTGKSFAALYKMTSSNPLIEGMEFEEFFDNIMEDLEKNSDNSISSKKNLSLIRKIEKEQRFLLVLGEKITLSRKNIQLETGVELNDVYKDHKKEYEKEFLKFQKENKRVRNAAKASLAKKRGIDRDAYKQKFDGKQLSKEEPVDSCEKAISERNKVIRDRNEIIKLSKEQNISPNEAAKIYFNEESRDLSHYTKKELNALLGKKEKNVVKEKINNNRVLTKLKTIIGSRTDKVIEILKKSIEEEKGKIIEESTGVHSYLALADALRKLDIYTNRLSKFEEAKSKMDKKNLGKGAFDVINDKARKNTQKEVFRMYTEDGKSVSEILKILKENGNEHVFTFDQVLNTVISQSKKYLTIPEIDKMKKTEKSIHENSIKKDAAEIKLQKSQEILDELDKIGKDNVLPEKWSYYKSWNEYYTTRIGELNPKLDKDKQITDNLRKKINKRKKVFSQFKKENIEKKAKEILENKKISSEETPTQEQQTNDSVSHNTTEESQEQPIEVEEMTAPPKMQFDVKAITRNGEVTPLSMKDAAEEMISLKGKDSTRTQDEQQVADEDIRQ